MAAPVASSPNSPPPLADLDAPDAGAADADADDVADARVPEDAERVVERTEAEPEAAAPEEAEVRTAADPEEVAVAAADEGTAREGAEATKPSVAIPSGGRERESAFGRGGRGRDARRRVERVNWGKESDSLPMEVKVWQLEVAGVEKGAAGVIELPLRKGREKRELLAEGERRVG